MLFSLHTFSLFQTLFSLLKHYLDLYIRDTDLQVSQSLHFFTTSISHGVGNYFLGVGDVGIADAILSTSNHCQCTLKSPLMEPSHLCIVHAVQDKWITF